MRRLQRPPIGPPGYGTRGAGPMRSIRGPPPPLGPRGVLGMGAPPIHGAVSSCTNSNDPMSIDSRLFVGNLNTVALSKEAVEAIFSQYGIVSGISLHKGFAFVQFTRSDDARWAGASEDGKMYAGQALDINIVSQPKKRSALKRSNSNTGKTINESPKKSRGDVPVTTNQSLQRTLVTLSNVKSAPSTTNGKKNGSVKGNAKCPSPPGREDSPSVSDTQTPLTNCSPAVSATAKESMNKDILICGVCKLQFSSLHSLTRHKKVPCCLKFSCQCNGERNSGDVGHEPSLLQCAKCDSEFVSAWALCQHCTQEHHMSIYKTETTKDGKIELKEEL